MLGGVFSGVYMPNQEQPISTRHQSGGIPAEATMPSHKAGIVSRIVYDVIFPEGTMTFDSREKAGQVLQCHQSLFLQSKMLDSPLNTHFSDFWSGSGYIQHSPVAVSNYRTAILNLLKVFEPQHRDFASLVTEGKGREVIADLQSTPSPFSNLLISHLGRLICIDSDNREWGAGTIGRESQRRMEKWPHIKYGMNDR